MLYIIICSFFSFFIFLVIVFSFVALFVLLPKYRRFQDSTYKKASGNSFWGTIFDKGKYGEYLTFSYLEKLKIPHRLLSTLYLPKKDGTTTEIDLIMIAGTGIYVLESKNYSGWIFGDEKNRYWTQTFPNGKKKRFFNPIWQNNGHISALKPLIDTDYQTLMKSIIIFSERFQLKNVQVISPYVKVIK